MYDNIGGKIKGLAKVGFAVMALGSFIAGIAVLSNGSKSNETLGVLLMLLGPVVSWISSWMLYGFGEIIDKLCAIEKNTRTPSTKSETEAVKPIADEREAELKKLLDDGLITKEEYETALSKNTTEA